MNIEKQMEYIARAQAGDIGAQNTLIELNLGFIRYVVSKCVGSGNVDEYLSDGVFGFIRGIQRFDRSKVRKDFLSIFWSCIRSSVQDASRMERRFLDRSDAIRRNYVRPTPQFGPSDFLELAETWEALSEARRCLGFSDRTWGILNLHSSGESFVALAERFGITKQAVAQAWRRAICDLRTYFK